MSNFLYHEPCPECGSKDNLGVWDDGHKFCFGCGYLEVPSGSSRNLSMKQMKEMLLDHNNNNKESNAITLPLDFTNHIPDLARQWLNNYGLTDAEVYRYKLGWSEFEQRLYFPIYGADDQLLFCQGRYFGKDTHKSRYLSRGFTKEFLGIFGDHQESGTVIACEDMISAIKIARVENAWCLFGSNLSTEAIERCSRLYRTLGVWLDRDKAVYSLKAHLRASIYFNRSFSIITEKDPKYYPTEQIKEFIQNHLDKG